jgi:dynein heavy chain 1
METVRHEEVLYSWLSEHKPQILCGPPGSGKTMTKPPDMDVVGLNFSSATMPELILKTFEQYFEYRKTPNGVIPAPVQIGRWLVVFCDEINLPTQDKYGTQRVISFLCQFVECRGYWSASDKAWVKLERIEFVGACNPPTDPGCVPFSYRFRRHGRLSWRGFLETDLRHIKQSTFESGSNPASIRRAADRFYGRFLSRIAEALHN